MFFLFKLVAVQLDSARAVVNLWENLTPGTLEHLGETPLLERGPVLPPPSLPYPGAAKPPSAPLPCPGAPPRL